MDVTGVGHYRAALPANALKAQGADVELVEPNDPTGHLGGDLLGIPGKGYVWANFKGHEDCDVIVVQRPLSLQMHVAVKELQSRGIKVVVDIDDDFENAHPNNQVWGAIQPKQNPQSNWKFVRATTEIADLVTVTTPALAKRYGKHGRVAILPNYIHHTVLETKRLPHDGVVVGWSGVMAVHPNDLQVTGGGVASALRATGATFRVVGNGEGVGRALGLGADPPDTGFLSPMEKYYEALAQLDVGIVPLADTPFNQAKSWLKFLEMSACGVPCVVSPTGPNHELSVDIPTLFADRGRSWERGVRSLAGEDWSQREPISAIVRKAASAFTIDKHCERWWDAWSTTLK